METAMKTRGWLLLALCTAALGRETPMKSTLASPLPEPLLMADGRPVTSPEQWRTERRPELLELFQSDMYGHLPPAPGNVTANLEGCDPHWLGGAATLKEVRLKFGPTAAPAVRLLIALPNHAGGRVPAIVGLNFTGNHSLVDSTVPAVPERLKPEFKARNSHPQSYPFAEAIARGYALASLCYEDIEPDQNGATGGVRSAYQGFDWGAIAAWAWGLSRAVDYLRTEPGIDPDRIGVTGHSRNGKAAMLAGALDERIAVTICCQAGCGGTAPSRGTVGESVERINTVFPHWFNAAFKTYNQHTEALPIDQHELVALCAPRPVLLSCAVEDTWANPVGQFEVLQAADRVYQFLGVEGLGAAAMPAENHLVDSRLGYFIRPGKHAMDERDWPTFFQWCDRWLKGAPPAAPDGRRPEIG
jgi:hypothetical protein